MWGTSLRVVGVTFLLLLGSCFGDEDPTWELCRSLFLGNRSPLIPTSQDDNPKHLCKLCPSSSPTVPCGKKGVFLAISFDMQRKQPSWTAYKLTKHSLNAVKQRGGFRNDPDLTSKEQLGASVYKQKGFAEYVKGHLAPNQMFKWDVGAEYQANLYSNIAPQLSFVNHPEWYKNAEYKMKKMVSASSNTFYVITGVIRAQNTLMVGRRNMATRKVGKVEIPTHWFKSFVEVSGRKVVTSGGWVGENFSRKKKTALVTEYNDISSLNTALGVFAGTGPWNLYPELGAKVSQKAIVSRVFGLRPTADLEDIDPPDDEDVREALQSYVAGDQAQIPKDHQSHESIDIHELEGDLAAEYFELAGDSEDEDFIPPPSAVAEPAKRKRLPIRQNGGKLNVFHPKRARRGGKESNLDDFVVADESEDSDDPDWEPSA